MVSDTILQIGVAPNRIDVLTSIPALDFDTCWGRRRLVPYGPTEIGVLSLEDLVTNKRAVGRPQDLIDVAKLELARQRFGP